jgi:hypothetical protein
MARARDGGNGRLEEAVAVLIQNQASFLARVSEMDRVSAERFGRIEAMLGDHSRVLAEHSRILAEIFRMMQALPETIREKIGFKAPEKPAPGR